MQKRNPKFWFDNEKKVMEKLGLERVPGSGNRVRKEDGENEYILCQLKSTEKDSITFKLSDFNTLIYHANQLEKIPLFVLEFVNGPMLLATFPEEIGYLADYLNKDLFEKKVVEYFEPVKQTKKKEKIKSTGKQADEVRVDLSNLDYEEPKEIDDYFAHTLKIKKQREAKKNGKRF